MDGRRVVLTIVVVGLVLVAAILTVMARRVRRTQKAKANTDWSDKTIPAIAEACESPRPVRPAVRLDLPDSQVDFMFVSLVQSFDSKENSQ